MKQEPVTLYSLSTCLYCKAIKKMLQDLHVAFENIEADLLSAEEKAQCLTRLKAINPRCSFPTTTIGKTVIIGYKVQEIKDHLGIKTETDRLFEMLKKVQEPKGYPFNRDREKTFELLRALLTNKDRYGYMACPCRLASGNRDQDADILCPCEYRAPDVAEYGSCYCGLYVSPAWNAGEIPYQIVPERRPLEKM